MSKISRALRYQRNLWGYSVAAVAELADLHPNTIHLWESGKLPKTPLGESTLLSYCIDVYGMGITEMIESSKEVVDVNDVKNIQDKLLSIRKVLQLSQREVSVEIGSSQRGLSYWENGDRSIDWEMCVNLLDFYGYDVIIKKR